MTWTSFHHHGETLRDVIASANRRRDGHLPLDHAGVTETFGDARGLVGALQLRWHTRLSGRLERELMVQSDLEDAVVDAWHATADELPGVRAILDRQRELPATPEVAEALTKADAKERALLAVAAGRASVADASAARVGAEIEERARATYRPPRVPEPRAGRFRLLKAAGAA